MDSMNTQNAYEQEIDLKDLLFAVLRKWKFVLASAVAFAVLLGGAKGFLTYRSFSDPEPSPKKRKPIRLNYSGTMTTRKYRNGKLKTLQMILPTVKNIWKIPC